jgi:hypothetical protein
MTAYDVKVTVTLAEGCTIDDAEMDSEAGLGTHTYKVKAGSRSDAAELALDMYHAEVAIGVLDVVDIETKVRRALSGSDPADYLDETKVSATILELMSKGPVVGPAKSSRVQE